MSGKALCHVETNGFALQAGLPEASRFQRGGCLCGQTCPQCVLMQTDGIVRLR